MDHWNNRAFLLTLTALPLACAPEIVDPFLGDDSGGTTGETTQGGTTSDSVGESTGGDATTSEVTATGDSTGLGSTSSGDASGSSTGDPDSTDDGSSSDGGSTGSSDDGDSSTTAAPTLCEAWAEAANICYPGYGVGYLENICGYYEVNPTCPMEAIALLECEANEGGPCGGNCEASGDALAACELMAAADELGCYEIPAIDPVGMIDAACLATAQKAIACDEADTYVGGFSMYADYPDALELMQSFCTSGGYWTFFIDDPLSSCGGAYEDLLACIQPLSCEAFDDLTIFPPLDGTCGAELTALECKCELGIN